MSSPIQCFSLAKVLIRILLFAVFIVLLLFHLHHTNDKYLCRDDNKHIGNQEHNFLSNCPKRFGLVGILVIIDSETLINTTYKDSISSIKCYANKMEVHLQIVNPFNEQLVQQSCSEFKTLLFLKHCAASVYSSKSDWLFVLDADTGVINFDRCLEEYIDERFDILHQERFHNGEIAAGNYIVKNSTFARNYLMQWAKLERETKVQFQNRDNGALHLNMYRALSLNGTVDCGSLYGKIKSWLDYDIFVGCLKKSMKGKRVFNRVKIYRRAMGFVRDSWISDHMWSQFDFMLHAMKPPDNVHFESTIEFDKCRNDNYEIPYKKHLKLSVDEMKPIMQQADVFHSSTIHLVLFNNSDIADCWPECSENLI